MDEQRFRDIRNQKMIEAWLQYVDAINEINRTFGGPRSGYVYVAQMDGPGSVASGDEGATLYKIGRSKSPATRLKQISSFRVTMPMEIRLIRTFWADDMYEAERYLHHAYAEFRTHGEWFLIPPHMDTELYALWFFEDSEFFDIEGNAINVIQIVRDRSTETSAEDAP